MNFVKKSLIGGTRGGVGALEGIRASLLPASDLLAWLWGLANSSCFSIRLAGGLLQGFRQARDLETIAMEL